MRCPNCDKETDDYSKFCSNCGGKVEEKPIYVQFDESIDKCSKIWYILGYIRGINIDDKEALKEFDDKVKNCPADIGDFYQEVIDHWENRNKRSDKNKKDKKISIKQ